MSDVMKAIRSLPPSDPLRVKAEAAVARTKRAVALYASEGSRRVGGAELALSFNGGKDSTVVLHVLRAAVHLHEREDLCCSTSGEGDAGRWPFLTFFFPHKDDFPEITSFVSQAEREHDLRLHSFPSDGTVGFKEGLDHLVREKGVRAIVIGTRQGDPNAKGQEYFCPSSEGWPAFMRVNPILDWTYSEVWSFLLLVKAKYCVLYDQGFTSLGSTKDTKKNALLLDRETGSYKPAYTLSKQEEERAGRT